MVLPILCTHNQVRHNFDRPSPSYSLAIVMSLTIRPAQLADAPAISAICAETAEAGKAPQPPALAPELVGLLYAIPYLHGPACVAIVAEDETGVCGYAVGTVNSQAFYTWLNSSWLPAQTLPQLGTEAAPIDRRFAAAMQRVHIAPLWHEQYPAHLHLNLLARAQGRGAGKRLMSELSAALAAAGATGIHWGADAMNLGALAFYKKMGYQAYAEEPGCIWFACALNAPQSN